MDYQVNTYYRAMHVMKMCHVCYYNNSDTTFRLLMSGDINLNPGPVSAATAVKINCLVMNARSLKSYHKDSTTNWQSVCNLHRFQGLVYAENSDVICVNETWLNQNINTSEILLSKNFNLNRKPSCNSLPKLLRFLVKEFYSVFAMGHPMKTQVGWMYSIIFCMKFVARSTIW